MVGYSTINMVFTLESGWSYGCVTHGFGGKHYGAWIVSTQHFWHHLLHACVLQQGLPLSAYCCEKKLPLVTTFKKKQFFKSKNVGAIWQAVVFWKNSVHVMDWLTYFYTWFTFELSGEFWGQSWSRVDHAIIKVVIVWCHIGCSCSPNVSRVFT